MPSPPPKVIISQIWVVHTLCEDECGQYGSGNKVFENYLPAFLHAMAEAAKHGVDIHGD